MLIGLRFRGSTFIPRYNDKAVEGGVHIRYWLLLDVDVTTLQNQLYETSAVFDHREDVLKMALVLFTERFLFGSNYRKEIFTWLFTLVEDL